MLLRMIRYTPPMQITESPLKDLFVCQPKVAEDARGAFSEVLRMDQLAATGITPEFVQMNHSTSAQNVLRGLHFQWDKPLGKFIRAIGGNAFFAAVDIRKNSTSFGKYFTVEVTAQNRTCLSVPPGFASGFCVTGDRAEIEYLYTAYYNPKGESNIRYDDPDVGIPWPIKDPILSERDQKAGSLAQWLERPEAELL